MKSTKKLCLLAVSALVVACAAPVKEPERSGFLSDYSRLQELDENELFFSAGKTGNYSKFIVDPVTMLYREMDPEKRQFTDEELEELKQYFHDKVVEHLTKDDGWAVVEEPGPGVARLRIGITDVDDTVGALNVTIYTKITGAGLGGASAEGEMVDSVSGEQLAAMVRWGSGSRVLRAGFTHTGDAKILFNKWAKALREAIDKAHGKS